MTIADLAGLITEVRNTESLWIDSLSTEEIVRLACGEESKVLPAVIDQIPSIVAAIDLIAERLKQGGRMFYLGAGTSGRLGILDAAELLPTFGAGSEMVKAFIAGGPRAIQQAVEFAEDDAEAGAKELSADGLSSVDAVVGITASGRTPYVLGGLAKAREVGAATIGLTCNRNAPIAELSDVAIEVVVGPEIVTGSTRMKAGTAQKIVLNLLSTTVMIKLGRVYQNFLVDMLVTNEKLRLRAMRMVAELTGASLEEAARLLKLSDWRIKEAVVMQLAGCTLSQASEYLRQGQGILGHALKLALSSTTDT
ncbi:MAG: N-acetylmuramic acid-6-phosphate etherase [Peptococcaceae bacterium 1109]|nr:MAG: N-acetylmuramic acid-6-phosphate etherase [Peptococcaceae bacterium 1109]